MKMKKTIIRVLIVMMLAIFGAGSIIPSLAVTDENKQLALSLFRYVNGNYTNGYALNTVGNESESHHPIYQIMSTTNGTNYYCLNATAGETWTSGTLGTRATYNRGYDLSSASDIAALKNDTNETYKKIGNSQYLNQILWILDNMYVPSTSGSASENVSKKRELLARSGMVFGQIEETDINFNPIYHDGYKYVPQQGYDFRQDLFNIKDGNNHSIYDSNRTAQGWFYYDTSSNYQYVEMPDELVEVAQQAALWYFTNYLENNSGNSQTYNVRQQGLKLACSNGTTNTNSHQWPSLEDDVFDVETDTWEDQAHTIRRKENIGNWKQEMATILCWYLIDAANNNASSSSSQATGNPLTIAPATTTMVEKTVSGVAYYVVGPMKIDETRTAVYSLNNTISVNGDTTTGAYISNENGARSSDQTVQNHVGQNFYVAVPKSKVSGNSVQISFDGSYKTNEKKLLISTTKTEQPVVEVGPKNKPLELKVNASIEDEREFDLALRKVLTKITGSNGQSKTIVNESGVQAQRAVTVDKSTIATNGTATYKHRKDPVVVEKGDIITYSITIYNEGEMAGYAKTIVDELPFGLVPKNTTGTYKSGNVEYSYTYDVWDGGADRITFTNVSKNTLAPYDGQGELSSETIEIECEVTQEPSNTANNYLTNIAYISGAHNTETNEDIIQDRDSSTNNNPSAQLNTTGDRYTGYHGGNNHNGDNSKNVYNDGTNNDDYFPGREDDDDFEIIVVKPAEFDLALKKYIKNIISADGTTRNGRNAPTINSKPLAEKTATTATYNLDKTPIKVKTGEYVLYNLTAYNEGQLDGYVKKITDNIPTGLEFVYIDGNTVYKCDSQGNATQIQVSNNIYQAIDRYNSSWRIDKVDESNPNSPPKMDTYNGESTISITCDIETAVSTEDGSGFLKAYDSSRDNNYDGSGISRCNVQVLLRVGAQNAEGATIRNEAAITKATDKNGNVQDISNLRDRDSQTNRWLGKDGDNYQDDEDYDRIILGKVDLALSKFITAVGDNLTFADGDYLTQDGTKTNAGSASNPYTRQTAVDTTPLKNGTATDAIYTQVKTPLVVPENSYVLYTIRVYNEGDENVYAGEVKDYLPNYLDYVDGGESRLYGWSVAADGKTVTTNYLSKANGTDKMLKAFDRQADDGHGSKLDYKDLQILCRVNANASSNTKLINSAEITKYEDENGNEFNRDVDSQPNNLNGKNQERREQDDDDFEVVKVEKKIVDLALTKFIIAVSEDESIDNGEYLTQDGTKTNAGSASNPYTRQTAVDTTPLKNATATDAIYTQVKTPLTIPAESYVLYNIRVYNEGDADLYAGEVKDYLPDHIEFVAGTFNTGYGWTVSSDGKTVTTNYLSKANGTDKMLEAFDRVNDDGHGSKLSYKDLPILCKIKSTAPGETKLVNSAEITKYEDKNGNEFNTDVDSQPNNLNGKNQERREQDDDDFEVVKVEKKIVDLALTKFITAISEDENIEDGEYLTQDGTSRNAGSVSNPYTRQTAVDTTPLKNGTATDAIYTQVKTPLTIPADSYILYNIRVYNEGETDVYAGEVKDYLPDYIEFVTGSFNTGYGWTVSSDGKTVTTNYLSKVNGTDKMLKAFDKDADDGHGSKLDYKDLPILCRVKPSAPSETKIINSAEITKYENKKGDEIDRDEDSEPNNLIEKNKEKREQDDDDYEVIEVEKKIIDLALTKFIAAVSNDAEISDGEYLTANGKVGSKDNPYTRATKVDSKQLRDDPNCHDATYIMVKDPLTVPANSYVLYNIRVYNEGQTDVYAGKVTDYLPEYLDYVDCEFNKNFGWTVESDGKTVSTTLLSYANGVKNLLKAFDKKTDDGNGSGLDYRDLQVLCRVNDQAPIKTNIINVAEITRYEDRDGKPIPDDDIDSKPDNVKEKEEDDDDYEVVLIRTFDLSLLKYVTEVYVTEDGKTTTIQTGNTGDDSKDIIPKVEVNKKKLNSTVVKFGFTIKITNEGDVEGFAKEITDIVPPGLKFYEEDNNGWKDEGNNLISTRLLENTLLQPGESAEVKVILRWINGSDNLGLKTNVAEITEDYNKEGIPDRDSTPNNRKYGEDDIDDAKVLLSIKTGLIHNFVMYSSVGIVILLILGTGIYLIKKYVL